MRGGTLDGTSRFRVASPAVAPVRQPPPAPPPGDPPPGRPPPPGGPRLGRPGAARFPAARPRRIRRVLPRTGRGWLASVLVLTLIGSVLIATSVAINAFGAGDLFERAVAKIDRTLHPPPDR